MIWETIKLALRTLRSQKFRTLLTTLSVTIGAFSIVVMMSLAQSGHRTLSRSIEELGGMRLILWIPKEGDLSARDKSLYDDGFTQEDLRALEDVPHLQRITSESTFGQKPVWRTADKREQPDVVAVAPGVIEGMSWAPEKGRVITAEDNRNRDRVVVITHDLAEIFFPDEEALGQTITVLSKPYRVVGVLEPRNMLGVSFGFSWDKSVFIPQQTAEDREGMPESARFLLGFTDDPKNNPTVVAIANSILLSNHRGVEDFQSLDFSDMLAQFYQFFQILDLVVAFIAGVSLLAGGIGVMNIMLVSVSERVREIGIRKAVGASVPAIMGQFLVEATTLSMTGGIIGILAGLGTTMIAHQVIQKFQDVWVPSYSMAGVALSLTTTAFIGLVFGSVPAWRAARLEIVEALRK